MRLFLLLFLFISSCIDGVLTVYGIRSGLITEANPIMDWLYRQSSYGFLLLKVLLPVLLLLIIPKKVSKPLRNLLIAACGIYLFILSLHGYWMMQLL
ncbi:DUF5658 family protein [Paenibacillus albus]|uniref:DUF5658 domain-containing protein n=1 Tax=Paenibacillus albus TaxID=2495582 RepID=A0A3Q8X930_9BACL|nr:DUF5658 family protein [Paenibacillus albus]AZN43335.1 hypothetical protein EJC50_29335 [Paenibacillus albus]